METSAVTRQLLLAPLVVRVPRSSPRSFKVAIDEEGLEGGRHRHHCRRHRQTTRLAHGPRRVHRRERQPRPASQRQKERWKESKSQNSCIWSWTAKRRTMYPKYTEKYSVFRQPLFVNFRTGYSDLLMSFWFIRVVLCYEFKIDASYLGKDYHFIIHCHVFFSILAFFPYRPSPSRYSQSFPSFAQSATTTTAKTLTMAKNNKNNDNNNNKTVDKNELNRRQQVREERERRRTLAA